MRTQLLSRPRRARNLALSLTGLLMCATFYANHVRADEGCGAQADFLVKGDPLMASVQPADCARLYDGAPAFAWPEARGGSFVVTVKHPDGSMTSLPTNMNGLSWDATLPPGDYTWTVTAVGGDGATSRARHFTVDRAAARS